jgi:hypothetical protein
MKVIVNDTITELTPELLAEAFAEMDQYGQASFYNHLDKVSSPWLAFQLQAITDDDGLTTEGRRVMQMIGEYSHWGILRASEAKP